VLCTYVLPNLFQRIPTFYQLLQLYANSSRERMTYSPNSNDRISGSFAS